MSVRPSVHWSVGWSVVIESKSGKIRISAPAHPSATGIGRVSSLVGFLFLNVGGGGLTTIFQLLIRGGGNIITLFFHFHGGGVAVVAGSSRGGGGARNIGVVVGSDRGGVGIVVVVGSDRGGGGAGIIVVVVDRKINLNTKRLNVN